MDKQNIFILIMILILIMTTYFFIFYKKTIIIDRMENFSGHRDDDFNVINFSDDNNEN